ncbi:MULTISPECIES: hypothetical protein [unclassified Bradyrhizobium]|uniref:hypothetical protein n=1 Tax=unclassified Bradyrhizobium TaxID=2631580 RepID=UPI0029164A2E|nr:MULTISPECIES: hypothetical protein [unclassified Bradyrhizobium]
MTREELYRMVWQKPLSRLAGEFGISGGRLASICKRLDVPYPPPGYWAKKEAGKPVATLDLGPRTDGIPEAAEILPDAPSPVASPRVREASAAITTRVGSLSIPDSLDNLHPRVRAWIVDHARRQKEREIENRQRRRDFLGKPPTIPDLTERDCYRFRVTSAIFHAVEKAGGRIEQSSVKGSVTFVIDGHKLECTIADKMVRSLKQWQDQHKWTAFLEYCRSGLESSGYLRVGIATYLPGLQTQWVESSKAMMEQLLPAIVAGIMAAGPALEQMKREREEQQKRYQEQEARRLEARRLREIDEKRWAKFRELAVNWDERNILLAFITEIEVRLAKEGDVTVTDRPLSEWLAWAKSKIDALDPFRGGTAELFQAIARVTQ